MSGPVIDLELTPEQQAVADNQWRTHGRMNGGIFGELRVATGVLRFRVYDPDETAAIQATLTAISEQRKAN